MGWLWLLVSSLSPSPLSIVYILSLFLSISFPYLFSLSVSMFVCAWVSWFSVRVLLVVFSVFHPPIHVTLHVCLNLLAVADPGR